MVPTMNERCPTENVVSTCSPIAAPMNHGVASSTVERTYANRTVARRPRPAAVVDPQHDRNVRPVDLRHQPGPQHLSQHDPGLDVDHVVLGQHGHRAGDVDARRLERLAQRRVSEDHRHVEVGRRGQEAVVVVTLDDRDVVSGGVQVG